MQKMTIPAVAMMMLTAAPAFADNPPAASGTAPHAAKPAAVTPQPAPAKGATPASTPESRSAAALALTHEPTYDEGTMQRIKEAAFSYSDIAVRGGWPTIPAEAKFALGVQGEHDELLRKRLLMSGDLADDVPQGDLERPVAARVEVDRLERPDMPGDGQRILPDEQVLERLEAVHRVARADPDDALVGLDPHDRGGERAARLRVPRGVERRVQWDDQAIEADGGDAHGASIAQCCGSGSLTVRGAASTVPNTAARRRNPCRAVAVREHMLASARPCQGGCRRSTTGATRRRGA